MPPIKLIPNDYILRKHPDITWRKWLEMVWNDIEWPVVILIGLISLFLGIHGFSHYQPVADKDLSFWDLLYLSLQLFSLQASLDSGAPLPWSLQIARFLSPALAAYALSQAFLVIFKEQLELFRLVRTSGHVIVCGLGRKGLYIVKGLRMANRGVVVIEKDMNNPQLSQCRELGAITLIGDARDGQILLKSGIQHANHLVAVCGEDGTNVEIAEQARKILRARKSGDLTCVIQIINTNLWTLLREKEFSVTPTSGFRLEFFNIYDAGARQLLQGISEENASIKKVPHILIIGMGNLGEHILRHATREWSRRYTQVQKPIQASVIDPNAKQKIERLQYQFPAVGKLCILHGYNIRTDSIEFQKAEFLSHISPNDSLTHIFICIDDSSLGLEAAAALIDILKDNQANIVIRMDEDSGVANFVQESHLAKSALHEPIAFGLLERTCKIELLDDGTHEILARAIHETFVKQEEARGLRKEININLVPWDQLTEDIRQSNRHQADHIGIKLNSIKCGITPWKTYIPEEFCFTPREVENLACLEHERWCEEKIKSGWRYGERRDDNHKIHPDLLAWDDPRLTRDAKEKDRNAVQLIPQLLDHAGFQIYRIPNKG